MSNGILIVRLILGLGMAAHGAQKLFGWFGGYGLKGTGGFFESIGFRPGTAFAAAAGLGEFGSGVLIALGLLNPIGAALMILVMIVAMLTVHRGNGFFTTANGVEVPLIYIAGALAIAFSGPGEYSLDALLGLQWVWAPQIAWYAIAVAVVGAFVTLLVRRTPAAQTA